MGQEDYVSLEIAKLLKEKGFDWGCSCINYPPSGMSLLGHTINNTGLQLTREAELCIDKKNLLSIPTIQMAVKWIRNMHKMHIEIRITNHSISSLINIVKYYWVVFSTEDCKWLGESTLHNPKAFDTVEEAYENGIEYTLKNLLK